MEGLAETTACCVLTLGQPHSSQVDRTLHVEVRRTPKLGDRRAGPGLMALNALVPIEARRVRADAILNLHVVTAPGALAAGQVLGTPYVQYVYAEEVHDRPWVTRLALRNAAAVICVSRFTRELALRYGASAGGTWVVPPGVDPPLHAATARSTQPTVVTVARLTDWYKGHDVMLRAMPLILRRVPSARWVVIGDGPLRAPLQHMAEAQGVAGRVAFVGSVDDAGRDAWLDRSHVFAMPSRVSERGGGEGFGIVYLEAGAHGLPVVAGGEAGVVDAVEDGVTGVLVNPTDVGAVANAVAGLLEDPVRAEALGAAGRRRARASTWSACAAQVDGVVRAVAEQGIPPRARRLARR